MVQIEIRFGSNDLCECNISNKRVAAALENKLADSTF